MRPLLDSVVKWWPIITGFIVIIIAGAETRFQVAELVKDKQADIKQWELIRKNLEFNQQQQTMILEMQRHMTPQAIQRWGEVQADVRRHEREINELQRHQH